PPVRFLLFVWVFVEHRIFASLTLIVLPPKWLKVCKRPAETKALIVYRFVFELAVGYDVIDLPLPMSVPSHSFGKERLNVRHQLVKRIRQTLKLNLTY